jgi:hypothetical protein
MIDGTYRLEVNTPLGRKTTFVTLATQGDRIHAGVDAPIIGAQRATGKLVGDKFAIEGSLKVPLFGTIIYTVVGKVVGDTLLVIIETNKGDFEFTGVRV